MKILYCHNYYRHRGGEDQSFESDVQLLREHGHEVWTYIRDNHNLPKHQLTNAIRTVWNREAERQVTTMIDRFRPDLMHCNNLFPQISPSVYRPARKRRIPIVQALRNYRHLCANSFLYRDGQVCTNCVGKFVAWNGLIHACYRNSYTATAVVVAAQFAHRTLRIQDLNVNAFITPTEFARKIHCDAGFDPLRVFSRPNFLLPDPGNSESKSGAFLFVGRLSPEKGLQDVLQAWRERRSMDHLRIVGEGPETEALKIAAADLPNVRFLGQLSHDGVIDEMKQARALIMPSRWFETFGRTIAEAFACGTPVLASRLGAMAELVKDNVTGLLFDAGNPESIAYALDRFCAMSASQSDIMAQAARNEFIRRFSPQASYRRLLEIYLNAAVHRGSVEAQWCESLRAELARISA